MAQKKTPHTMDIAKRIPPSELSTLLKVSSALATSLDLGVVLQTAIESACEVLGLETGAIYELDGDWLYLGATTPPLAPEMDWLRKQPEAVANHPHIHRSITQGRPVSLPNAREAELSPAEAAIVEARNLCSNLYIPLMLEDKPIGVMIVSTSHCVRQFSEEEIDLCRILAYQVTLALTNARLFRSLQQSNIELTLAYDATLLGWSLALEMRDQETQGHTQRVTRMAVDLARKLGVAEEELVHVRRGSLLHDIGKMGIPDTILKKPGPLSEEEWAIMRQHPEYAYQFLKQIFYLSPALEIPYCHHEKWDGTGYPRGLKGEEIPFSARVFAVVDVFDALTSDRPYRKKWEVEAARCYLRKQAGKHFDPRVVEAFLEEPLSTDEHR